MNTTPDPLARLHTLLDEVDEHPYDSHAAWLNLSRVLREVLASAEKYGETDKLEDPIARGLDEGRGA